VTHTVTVLAASAVGGGDTNVEESGTGKVHGLAVSLTHRTQIHKGKTEQPTFDY